MRRETTAEISRHVPEKADVVSRLTSCVSRLLLCVLALTSAPIAAYAAEEAALPWEEARRFAEALETIRTQYVEEVGDAALLDNAIRGMVQGLDPYSLYLDPSEYEQARIDALGRYEGIGVEVMRADGGYVIVAAIDGGPAARAGLRAGDLLLQANETSLETASATELDAVLHGPLGASVRLLVQRADAAPFAVTLVREVIRIPTISGERLDDIIYIRIAQFSDTSAADLAQLLRRLQVTDARGLIVDLRNNAGGVVDGAVDIADAFLEDGIIVTTRGRAPGQNFDYRAQSGDLVDGLPLAVLLNGGSASAAEILAGALQDHRRALLLGTHSFGKGAVQSLIPLEGGGALKLTTAYYATPSGRLIESAGIEPDVAVERADAAVLPAAADPLVARAREYLRETVR